MSDHAGALYRLMAWLSPAYPVGAFSYSSGLEWAVEAGDVADAPTLNRWVAAMLADGGGFCDAGFLGHAHRAVMAGDDPALAAVAELAVAFAPSKERHLETTGQGGAFLATTTNSLQYSFARRTLSSSGAPALTHTYVIECLRLSSLRIP